jgi:hypothetical protein
VAKPRWGSAMWMSFFGLFDSGFLWDISGTGAGGMCDGE